MAGYTQHDGRKGCFNPLEQYTTEPLIKEEEKLIDPVVRREFINLPSTEKEELKPESFESSIEVKKLKRRRKVKESHLIS
jgi:hypothetical protein